MTNKVRLSLDSRFLLMLIMTCVVSSAKANDSRWNIVLLFVDDLGWTEIQQRHPAYKTPNIDGLASDGVEFTRAYVPSPACSPSRAALVTRRTPPGSESFDIFQLAQNTRILTRLGIPMSIGINGPAIRRTCLPVHEAATDCQVEQMERSDRRLYPKQTDA